MRQLTALIGEDSTNLSRELVRLEKTGILVSATEGRQKYYQANRRSPVFDELQGGGGQVFIFGLCGNPGTPY